MKPTNPKTQKPPKFLQSSLWSYNLNSLDLEKDKELIITQVLNYGTWPEVKWLLRRYSDQEIKEVVKNPRRGMWLRKVLNFWTRIYGIKLEPARFEDAIFEPTNIKQKSLKSTPSGNRCLRGVDS